MKNKIKMLQIGMTRNLGGIETFLMQQFYNINKNIFHYDFVNITSEYNICFEKEIISLGGQIFAIPSRSKSPLKHYLEWIKLLRKKSNYYDAIVLNTNNLEYIFPLFIAKLFGIKLRIIHSHSSGSESKKSFLRKCLVFFNSYLLKFSANLYLACSEKAASWMFKRKECIIIPNAIDINKFKFNEEKRNIERGNLNVSDNFVFLNIGRFSYVKNQLFLIDVFYELNKLIPNSKLILVTGSLSEDDYYNQLSIKVNEYGLSSKVIFIRMSNDIPAIMQASDVFIMPSLFEGFGTAAIEAQAAGLPTIISTGIPEEVEQTNLVIRLSLNLSAYEWAKRIYQSKLKRKPNQYIKLVNSEYNIRNSIKKFELLIKEKLKS